MKRFVLGMVLAASMPAAVDAATVVNPVPQPIGTGIAVSVSPFVTIPPATGSGAAAAAIQSMRTTRDGRIFVNDTRGVISVTNAAGAAPAPFFDIRTQDVGFTAKSGQTGLLSFAFHPNFGIDPTKPGYDLFYTVDTTAVAGQRAPDLVGKGGADHHNVVREWTVADPRAASAQVVAQREVLRVSQPFDDHGPGTIAFNPAAAPGSSDYGKLYIGFGDGGGVNDPADNAQDLTSPFGKILRIDPADPDGPGGARYSVPRDNPYSGKSDALGEVWASGLRNPQQFGWDPLTGKMYIADIGQAQLEEVNVGMAGANYGWPAREGTFGRYADKGVQTVNDDPNPGGFVDPIAQYDHDEGNAITGAVLYRGALMPELYGQMIVADLVLGRLFYFSPGDVSQAGGVALLRELQLTIDGVATSLGALEGPGRIDLRLGLDQAGEIYLLTKANGDIYRLGSVAAVPEPATWMLSILGFGLVAWMLRRRREIGRLLLGYQRQLLLAWQPAPQG